MDEKLNDILLNTFDFNESYYLETIDVNEQDKTIDVVINLNDVKNIKCPLCMKVADVYDKLNKKWRHIDFNKYKVYINFKTPRVKCNEHGVKLTKVSWAEPRHGFTKQMESFICELSKEMSLVKVGNLVDEHDTRIRRIIEKKGEK